MGYYRGDCGRGDYYRGDYYRGDPGFLSGVGNLFKGITGAVAKAGIPGVSLIAGGINSLIPSKVSGANVYAQPMAPQGMMAGPGPVNFGGNLGPLHANFGIGGSYERYNEQGGNAQVSITPSGAIVPCQLKGYHPNKSTYYRSGGQRIQKGSVCVKSRHMNAGNGRALKRALRRAYAFKKLAMRSISLLSPPGKKKRFGGFKKKR